VVDYTREDFTRRGESYDVIFDVVGKASYGRGLGCLKENGRYLVASPRFSHRMRGKRGGKVTVGGASYSRAGLEALGEMLASGQIKSVIDRSYPLAEMVAAHEYVESGQKKGNVVILVS
jgi:NADPH:quinone reductase-like Zn-dependent oxidoreductase